MTEADYNKMFDSLNDAIEFEGQSLSAMEEWDCPPAVRAVKRGEDASPAYWDWLIEQVEDAHIEAQALAAMTGETS